jgi:hypothetical protein
MTSDLRKLSRLIWLLIGGGAVLFVVCALLLAYTHPNAPAKTLVNRHTVWLFLPSALMGGRWGLFQPTPLALPALRMALDHTVSDPTGMPPLRAGPWSC